MSDHSCGLASAAVRGMRQPGRAIYTCTGNSVSLAPRLEAHTRTALRPMPIDDATRASSNSAVPDRAPQPLRLSAKAAVPP